MKGMVIRSNIAKKSAIEEIALSEGLVNVLINVIRCEYVDWSVGGLKMPEEVHIAWDGGRLMPGDEIEIEFADIDHAAPCVWEESHSRFKERMKTVAQTDGKEEDDSYAWKRKLERYHRLKAILEEENLIRE